MGERAIRLPEGSELRLPLDENVEYAPIILTHVLEDLGEFKLLIELVQGTLRQALLYGTMREVWDSDEYTDDERENVLEALAWVIRLEPTPWLYSLNSVSDVLGWDADRVRQLVYRRLNMSPEEIVKLLVAEGWQA